VEIDVSMGCCWTTREKRGAGVTLGANSRRFDYEYALQMPLINRQSGADGLETVFIRWR